MNKKTIITILLALVAMAGQAQSPIPESIVDTYWRNEVTGDWEIGFTESCAIYDCKIWQYGNINEKNGKVVLALNNGNKTLGVTIGKQEGGKCKMSIGKQKKQTYSLITTRTLSYYPQPDQTPFIDNGFQEGDSATIIGWIKDYPESKGKSLAFEARFGGFVPGQSSTLKGQTNSNGHFTIKAPVENTQVVFVHAYHHFMDPCVEPGDTIFILNDDKNDKLLFMGRNARLQNEFFAVSEEYFAKMHDMEYNDVLDENSTEEQMRTFANQRLDVYHKNEAKLDSLLALHPTLSRKFEESARMLNLSRMLSDIFDMDANTGHEFPQTVIDDMLAEVRKNVRKPYSMWHEFYDFPWMYLQHAIFSTPRKYNPIILNADLALQLEKEGWLTLSDEKRKLLEKQDIKSLRNDILKALNEKTAAEGLEWEFQLADSIFTDPVLRECAKANRVYGMLDATNRPLNKSYLEAANRIQLPAARNAILAKNAELTALQNKPMTFTGLRPSSDVADMSDGEKILRKIIEPYKGKLILMDIWGTWCGPCKEALSHSQEEYERLKDFGLVYLYLANNSSDESWKNVIKMYDITGDNVVHYNLPDEQQKAVEQYLNVNAFPTYKLIDREGTILDADADPRNLEKLARLLERLK